MTATRPPPRSRWRTGTRNERNRRPHRGQRPVQRTAWTGGGERPDEGDGRHEAINESDSSSARPASPSEVGAAAGSGRLSSADVPTWQVQQCVVDFRWHARSWWANGSTASASTYAAATSFMKEPSRCRVRTTISLYRVWGSAFRNPEFGGGDDRPRRVALRISSPHRPRRVPAPRTADRTPGPPHLFSQSAYGILHTTPCSQSATSSRRAPLQSSPSR